jgi:hypothetical protein
MERFGYVSEGEQHWPDTCIVLALVSSGLAPNSFVSY